MPLRRCQAEIRSSDRNMFQLLLLAAVLLGGYVLLTQTLFRRSKSKGNRAIAGKTVIITGEATGQDRVKRFNTSGPAGSSFTVCSFCCRREHRHR